jgi:hypothetical protein
MKFKFLSAALAGLFLSFSSVVDAAPVRYDFNGNSSTVTASGFVVVDDGNPFGVDLFGSIIDWSFQWVVDLSGKQYSWSNATGRLWQKGPPGFVLNADRSVREVLLCASGIERDCQDGPGTDSKAGFGVSENYFIAYGDNGGFLGQANDLVSPWSGPFEVPEPSSLAIFALGIMGLALRRFKKQS